MKWLNLYNLYRYILFQSWPPSQMLPMFFFVLPIPLQVGVFSLSKAPIAFLFHNTKTYNTRPTLKMCLHHLILKRWLFNRSFQCLSGYMQQKFLFLKSTSKLYNLLWFLWEPPAEKEHQGKGLAEIKRPRVFKISQFSAQALHVDFSDTQYLPLTFYQLPLC